MTNGNNGGGGGVPFLVSAAVVYDIVAATNSSPQTTEINAKTRASTLMKWVNLGLLQAAGFVLLAAIGDKKNRKPLLLGGGLGGILLWAQYVHARNAGVRSAEPGTEDYGPAARSNGTGRVRTGGVTNGPAVPGAIL